MTRQEIRDRILIALNDSPTVPIYFATSEINAVIQEAQEIVAEEVRAWKRTVYVPKREGWQVYNLLAIEPNCMAPFRIWDHTTNRRLQVTSMHQIDLDRQRWLTVTGSQPDWWYPVSWGQFGVYPATASGEGVLRVDCLVWPTALLDDADEPESPEPDHDDLVLYGVYMSLMQQFEVMRATERFVRFTDRWTDSRYRNELQRIQARYHQRRGRRDAYRE